MKQAIEFSALGPLFHKTIRSMKKKVKLDDLLEVLMDHDIEVMPEEAGFGAFYDVGFGDGLAIANANPTYNVYYAHNEKDCEYVFVHSGNTRGALGKVKKAHEALLKLVK